MHSDPIRRERLTRAAAAADLDAIVCTSASDVLLLSGYWPVMSMSVAVLTRSGECVLLVPDDEAELAGNAAAVKMKTYQPVSLSEPVDLMTAIRSPLGQVVRELGLSRARLGVREKLTEQPASYVVSSEFHHSLSILLRAVAPDAVQLSCDHLLETQKAAKTPHELERMRVAAEIAAAGFHAADDAIECGLRETDVAARIQMAFDTAAVAESVDRSYGSFYCMSGPNSATAAAAFARTRHRRLAEGDLVMIHCNTCADGFWTDVTRTYTVGEASDRQQALRGAILEARGAALATIRDGVAASGVDHAARAVLTKHGLADAFKHATGHGVGFAAANAAGLPRIHPLSPDVLADGMTFNVEPAAYFEGYGGMRHCDLVVATTDGVRVLTDF